MLNIILSSRWNLMGSLYGLWVGLSIGWSLTEFEQRLLILKLYYWFFKFMSVWYNIAIQLFLFTLYQITIKTLYKILKTIVWLLDQFLISWARLNIKISWARLYINIVTLVQVFCLGRCELLFLNTSYQPMQRPAVDFA